MRKVFITGGSRGIGAALVKVFWQANYSVTFTYHKNLEKAQSVVDSLGSSERVRYLSLDLNDKDQLKVRMQESIDRDGSYDVVIHNAASHDDQVFYFMEEDQWSQVIQSSLNSFFYINKAVLPGMIEKRFGRILLMASVSGEAGQRGQTNYAAAKGALIAAGKSLAREVARKGVLVNIISPGLIDTDMTADLPIKDILPMIPVGRIGRPEEVAKVALFLASEDSSYINGTVLQVNGGLYT